MDIEGVGDVLAFALVDDGLVDDVSGLYALTAERLATLPRMGEKRSPTCWPNRRLEVARARARAASASGSAWSARRTRAILAGDFGSIDALRRRAKRTCIESEGIGAQIAASVVLFFQQTANRALIERLRAAGVDLTAPKRERAAAGPLAGKTFVLTGTLPNLTREEATRTDRRRRRQSDRRSARRPTTSSPAKKPAAS